jgi:hypothetical protein
VKKVATLFFETSVSIYMSRYTHSAKIWKTKIWTISIRLVENGREIIWLIQKREKKPRKFYLTSFCDCYISGWRVFFVVNESISNTEKRKLKLSFTATSHIVKWMFVKQRVICLNAQFTPSIHHLSKSSNLKRNQNVMLSRMEHNNGI